MKKKIIILILFIAIILIVFGIYSTIKGRHKTKTEEYICKLTFTVEGMPSESIYKFKTDGKKITNHIRTAIDYYGDLDEYNTAKSNYNKKNVHEKDPKRIDCKFDDKNKKMTCRYDVLLNEKYLDYSLENWLDKYLESFNNKYSCSKVEK